jgi:type II secretory pathway pseudopilin PulG
MTPDQMPPPESLPEELPTEPRGLSFKLRELILIAALIALVLAALTPTFQRRRDLALVSQVRADMRPVITAIEAYFIDWMNYPLCGIAEGPPRVTPDGTVIPSGTRTVHSHLPEGSGARRMMTFGLPSNLATPHMLTTPVAYLTAWPPDPFADTRGATFGYYVNRHYHPWILWSVGPDRDENAEDGPGDISPVVEQLIFPPMDRDDISPDLFDRVFDPTNGIPSNGDIAWGGSPLNLNP